jgi:hypothetical protein
MSNLARNWVSDTQWHSSCAEDAEQPEGFYWPFELAETDEEPESSGDVTLEQLSAIFHDRLEQALHSRLLEWQLTAMAAQLDLAMEAYRLAVAQTETAERSLSWPGYLISLLTSGPLAYEQATRAINLWETLRKAAGDIIPPHAAALDDGTFSMAWDKEQHHFEVELQPGGLFDWFYLDRLTDQIQGEENLPVGYDAAPMIEMLRKVAL